MKINFKTLNTIINHIISANYPIMIRGKHGIGKSEYIYQIGQLLNLKIVERRASQMTEGDILGMPVVKEDNKATTWKLPDWFVECCENPRLMFLDEIDRASIEVRQAIFELGDSRKIAGMTLHPDSRIFAACNSGEHEQSQFYQVSSLDPAELDRWYVIDFEPTINEWCTWANDNNVMEDIVEYVLESQIEGKNVLEHTGQFQDNVVYPSRRSWTRLSNTLQKLKKEDPDFSKIGQEDFMALCYGFLGNEVSISFYSFLTNPSRKEAYQKIIENGEIEYAANWSTTQHMLFINRIVKAGIIKKLISSKQIENLAKYYLKLPSELGIKLWSSMGDSVIYSKKDIEKEIAIYNFYRFNRCKIDDTSIPFHFIEQFSPTLPTDLKDMEEGEKNV